MVEFKKLFIIPYNKGLYIDVAVLDMPYFDNVYIDRVAIDTQETFDTKGISATPVYEYKVEGDVKSLQLAIADNELKVPQVEGTMFFVYIVTKGIPSSNTPCGLDNNPILGVGVDTYQVYRKALIYIRECYESCKVPREFIDFILRYKAFKMCLKTRDFPLAITYWNKFWKTLRKSPTNCGCHGRDFI